MKRLNSMRILYVLLLALCSPCVVCAQANSTKLADSIDTSRTIIAKLDHATQDDPPPNVASSILVRVHQEAMSFITLADAVSTTIRDGGAPAGTSMFTLYSQFIDLFDQYELFTSVETRRLGLDKVRSVAMGKEFFETKTLLEAATYVEMMRMEEELRSCRSPKPR
jgi:hypothetical protein